MEPNLDKKIKELCERGVASVYPSKEALVERLKKAEKMSIYLGIDPTASTLHLGHSIQLRKLSEFQKLGHQVILLIGDFTATIGDPSGKLSTRKMLSHEEVMANAKLYKKQASSWLSFTGPGKSLIKYNSKWLAKMTLQNFIKLSSNITVDQLLERDMFKKRREEGKPVFLHEFYYPLLQGYDSVAMDVDGEVGGTDQTFNMLAGRDLMRTLKNKDKFVITTKLLEDNNGKKMGKTEGNMVALSSPPQEMLGKIMSWSDSLILPGLELCTNIDVEEIEKIKKNLEAGANPRDAKLKLAEEITAVYYGKKKASEAKKNFLTAFSLGGVPNDVLEIKAAKESVLSDLIVKSSVVSSKTEYRRLMDEGAVRFAESGEKITDPFYKVSSEMTLRIGKHRFVKIKIS